LVHIGGGELLKTLKERAKALGLADRITWRGAHDQAAVLDAYREADVFVLPSRVADNGDRDGLPNVLVEAQSQRVCCLSTSVGGIPELICSDETGILVPPDDSVALAEGLVRLISDPDLRDRLGRAGEQRARETFDKRAGITQLVALFDASLAQDGDAGVLEAAQ
jgi:glycosyltransferase involved in cell wall biosynthesis